MSKKTRLGYVKEINAEERSVTAYVSTHEWDRMQERFAKGAWNLEAFRKNPVVLMGHDTGSLPIGKAVSIAEDEHGLLAKTVFHEETQQAKDVFNLYKAGFLNAFSVGFIPKNFVAETLPDGQSKGIVFTDAELYEYSAVAVPANPGALVSREVAEMVVKTFGENLVQPLAGDEAGRYLVVPDAGPVPRPADDLDAALKQLADMARIVKGKPLDEQKLSLVKSAIDTLHEAVVASTPGLAAADFARLSEAVKGYADVLRTIAPQRTAILKQTISQVGKALTGRAG
jgi:HK97 family phage prohead protease